MARTVTVNKDEIKSDFELIPAKTRLKATIYEIDEKVTGPSSKNPGSEYFNYTAKITDDQYTGREIKYNYVPLEPGAGAMRGLADFSRAVGWPVEGSGSEVRFELPDDLSEVLGTEVMITVSVQKSNKLDENGEPYLNNRVSRIESLRKAEPQSGGGITDPVKSGLWD